MGLTHPRRSTTPQRNPPLRSVRTKTARRRSRRVRPRANLPCPPPPKPPPGSFETERFYKALAFFGLDFTMIALLFPGRDRFGAEPFFGGGYLPVRASGWVRRARPQGGVGLRGQSPKAATPPPTGSPLPIPRRGPNPPPFRAPRASCPRPTRSLFPNPPNPPNPKTLNLRRQNLPQTTHPKKQRTQKTTHPKNNAPKT